MAERLHAASTLEALSQVRRMGLMDPVDCDFLSGSYLFLMNPDNQNYKEQTRRKEMGLFWDIQ